jgi:hypothetical protein
VAAMKMRSRSSEASALIDQQSLGDFASIEFQKDQSKKFNE